MNYKKYNVKFSIDRDIIAENEEEAKEFALDRILSNNGYYVHDYIDFESIKCLGNPSEDELAEYLNNLE